MALTAKKVSNFASYRGTPSSETVWDKLDWEFDARNVKVLVTAGTLELSMDGKEIFCSLPTSTVPYDFRDIGMSRMWARRTGATVEFYAYGLY